MVELGIRIELYEHVQGMDVNSEGYLGAILRDDGYQGVTAPSVGDFVALSSVRAGEIGEGPTLHGDGGPFLRVRHVEHYLRPVRDGATASWSRTNEPVAVLVLHSPVGVDVTPDDPSIAELLRRYAADGWNLNIGSDSPLFPAYKAATTE
ncbi:hypothetical protein B4N89_45770 [Embleya scabrispora]|uniref:Uncharacterized protein n=1 Tax=Embleya scabrispora TaxID=159449 RepID=A0A1T3NIX2_9ACTN|nr:hypothetical protein [Embleya scabrispora]OPC76787.1 hypothetical protein B4N89_45770 [Embleya scabrispora]